MGGRGGSSGGRSTGVGGFEAIDVKNTKLSSGALNAIKMRRYEAWAAARRSAKSIKEVKEPRMTKKQREIYDEVKGGNYKTLDHANNNTFRVIQQASDHDLYSTVNRVSKMDYGVESDYYTRSDGKRIKQLYNFPEAYNNYRKAVRVSNELYNRAITRGLKHE